MDGKHRILSQTDQEILSLCKVKAKDEEIEGSEDSGHHTTIICLKGKIEKASN